MKACLPSYKCSAAGRISTSTHVDNASCARLALKCIRQWDDAAPDTVSCRVERQHIVAASCNKNRLSRYVLRILFHPVPLLYQMGLLMKTPSCERAKRQSQFDEHAIFATLPALRQMYREVATQVRSENGTAKPMQQKSALLWQSQRDMTRPMQ